MPAIVTKLQNRVFVTCLTNWYLALGLSRKPRNRVPQLSDGRIVAKVGLQSLRV